MGNEFKRKSEHTNVQSCALFPICAYFSPARPSVIIGDAMCESGKGKKEKEEKGGETEGTRDLTGSVATGRTPAVR